VQLTRVNRVDEQTVVNTEAVAVRVDREQAGKLEAVAVRVEGEGQMIVNPEAVAMSVEGEEQNPPDEPKNVELPEHSKAALSRQDRRKQRQGLFPITRS